MKRKGYDMHWQTGAWFNQLLGEPTCTTRLLRSQTQPLLNHFLPARRQRKELRAFWKATGVQAGVGSTAAEGEAGVWNIYMGWRRWWEVVASESSAWFLVTLVLGIREIILCWGNGRIKSLKVSLLFCLRILELGYKIWDTGSYCVQFMITVDRWE